MTKDGVSMEKWTQDVEMYELCTKVDGEMNKRCRDVLSMYKKSLWRNETAERRKKKKKTEQSILGKKNNQ